MLRFLLIILLIILVFRIIRNFLRGYSSGYNQSNTDRKKKINDYKNIEEAQYTEVKDNQKQSK